MPIDPASSSLIHARDLTKRFHTFTAVDAVDFDVARGEAFGFHGPNGAGKTSTMRCATAWTSFGPVRWASWGPARSSTSPA